MVGTTILLQALSAVAAAKVIQVQVGATGLAFSPDSVTAAKGDELNFVISSGHSVAQSTFDSPCSPKGSDAIYSGFSINNFVVTVNGTDPLWFYCSTPSHCSSGMVLAVNPPANEGISSFKQKASGAGDGTSPSVVQGGVVNGKASAAATTQGGASTATTSGSAPASTASGSTTAAGSSGTASTAAATTPTSSGMASGASSPAGYVLVGLSGVLAAVNLL